MKANEIKTLLAVLAAACAAALILALFMLRVYNPESGYPGANVLLTPENAFALEFSEPLKTGKKSIDYRFHSVTFVHAQVRGQTKNLTKEQYSAIYSLVKNDIGIQDPTNKDLNLYTRGSAGVLQINVATGTEISAESTSIPFITVVFAASGDDYKVNIRHAGNGDTWVYYHHPGIFQKVLERLGGDS
jgi:hypothetical protein